MGTQQILLLVLSVIVVGVSISVGITMFANQSYNANQQAVASELQNYGVLVLQYYKTTKAQGGAGQDSTNISIDVMSTFMGFSGENHSVVSENGEFRIMSLNGSVLTLKGLGTEIRESKRPLVTTRVYMATGQIIATVSSGTTF